MKRRDFIINGAIIGAGVSLTPRLLSAYGVPAYPWEVGEPFTPLGREPMTPELAARALDAARRAGASYADVRINRNRNQAVGTRERQITGLSDNETMGFGVRVLADGSWGFAASATLTGEEVERIAQRAVAQAKANARARPRPVELAPAVAHPSAVWRSPVEIDPFTVSIEDKVAHLLEANAAALAVSGIRFVNSSMFFLREEKYYSNSEGTTTDQVIYRASANMTPTAVASDNSDFQSVGSATDLQPRGLGYELVRDARLVENATKWAENSARKLSARSVQPGRYDLVLMPSHLWLTVHESIAHPTELDRIMGYEANYAGTSFISLDMLGNFRYGRDFMNVQGERSTPGALSTVGYDDEGVQPRDYLIVKDGVLNDLQTTREQAPWLADWYRTRGEEIRSHGNSYAQSWADVQFQRMPNINLLPHPTRDVALDELIGGVENGILIDGDGSFSIDQQRYNAQFGGQAFYEIVNGKVGGMLKDVAYQIRTPEFWQAMDLMGGPSTNGGGGAFGDGKGQPAQSNAVSHACPPTRHRDITVINTGRSG
ncbi:MAG: TldD/PmbA family protein [Gemmatimonadetes bacterium]|nr:TldD/PmbA family protein [Gemmatimonadota bacterium]